MAWLIAAFVFVVPLVFFPRAAGYILSAAVLFLGGWALYEGLENRLATAEEEKVAITAVFDPVACPPQTPVAARVSNGSSKAILAVKFDISVKRRGYSNEIGRLSRLLDDQPMAPAAESLFCYALPVLIPPVDPKELEFLVPIKFVTFQ